MKKAAIILAILTVLTVCGLTATVLYLRHGGAERLTQTTAADETAGELSDAAGTQANGSIAAPTDSLPLTQGETAAQSETAFSIASASPVTGAVQATATTVPQAAEKEWVKAYKKFLKNYDFTAADQSEYRFALLYITDDDIPELAVACSEIFASSAVIYMYYQGAVRRVGSYGPYSTVFYVDHGSTITTHVYHGGYASESIYKISNATASETYTFSNNEDQMMFIEDEAERVQATTYEINNEKVDRETYYAVLEREMPENESSFQVYGNGYAFTDANIEKYVK